MTARAVQTSEPDCRAEWARARWLAAACLLAAGCLEPSDSFRDYSERARALPPPDPHLTMPTAGAGATEVAADAVDDSSGEPDCLQPLPEQIAPEYVFTMSMRLTPGQAFLSRGRTSVEQVGDELHLYLELVYLAAGDRSTPVGEPYRFGPLIIDAQGNLHSEPALYTLPAAANPALCGVDLSATSAIVGQMCRPAAGEPYARSACGSVTGVLHPPPLEQDLAEAGGIFRLEMTGPDTGLPETLIGCFGDPLAEPQCM